MPKSEESKKSEVIKKESKKVNENDAKNIKKEKKIEKRGMEEKAVKEIGKETIPEKVRKSPRSTSKKSENDELNEKASTDKTKKKTKTTEFLLNEEKIKIQKTEEKMEKPPIVSSILETTRMHNSLEKAKLNNENDQDFKIKNEPLKNEKLNSGKRGFQTLEVAILVILTCIISLAVGGFLGIKLQKRANNQDHLEVAGNEIQEFIKDYNYLIENYYGDIDKKELLNVAFKSMVDSLGDSYSGAIDESTSNNFDIELKGDYEGLGIEIINDSEKNILIYSIIPNSPASKVDIKVGDKLITVNNTDVRGMTTTDFIKNVVKGSGALEFVMVFEREGQQHTVTIKKETITLNSVTSKTYYENGKRIAYIKVSIFAENTYDQFKKELARLESEGFESLIIDLRDNSGGHLNTVENMIGLFLDSSHVIYQTENKKEKKKVYSPGKVTKKYPIVIIGNAMSASASEVMIGALTEEYGAILIGNQSFGKGTVQELHSLTNGDEYKFTTKKWLTPKGNWVHNNGIKPKIEVTLSKEYYGNPVEENDNQLRTALNYLAGIQ